MLSNLSISTHSSNNNTYNPSSPTKMNSNNNESSSSPSLLFLAPTSTSSSLKTPPRLIVPKIVSSSSSSSSLLPGKLSLLVHEQQLLFELPLTRYYNYKSVSYTIFSRIFFNHNINYKSSSSYINCNDHKKDGDNKHDKNDTDDTININDDDNNNEDDDNSHDDDHNAAADDDGNYDDTKIHANDADYAFNKLHNYISEIEYKLSKSSITSNSHGDNDDHRSRSSSSTIDNYRSGIDQLYLSSPISFNIIFYDDTDGNNETYNDTYNSHHEIKANRSNPFRNNSNHTLQATPSSLSSSSPLSLSWYPSICFPHSLLAFIISPLLSEGFILDDYITSLKDMHLESSISGLIVPHSYYYLSLPLQSSPLQSSLYL